MSNVHVASFDGKTLDESEQVVAREGDNGMGEASRATARTQWRAQQGLIRRNCCEERMLLYFIPRR